jgi:hypothetical protein
MPRFTSQVECRAVSFLWHFPARHRDWVLPSTLSCGARTFLPPALSLWNPGQGFFMLYLSPQTERRAAAICPALTHSHSKSSRAICHGSFDIYWNFRNLTMFFGRQSLAQTWYFKFGRARARRAGDWAKEDVLQRSHLSVQTLFRAF